MKKWINNEEKDLVIATHNGVFHADEVCAISLLRSFVKCKIQILRTRNKEELERADILVDVGGEMNNETIFDHHQKGFKDDRFEVKPSSSGLILRKLRDEEIISQKMFNFLYSKIIKGIDALDNGIEEFQTSVYSISHAVSSFNPSWDSEEDENEAFNRALDFMRSILEREINNFRSKERAANIVRSAINAAREHGRKFIVLEKFVPWQEVVVEEGEGIEFVLFPTRSGDFGLQTVPVEVGSFTARKSLPESWAVGNDVSNINESLNVKDTVFSHVGRFFACWKTRKSAIIAAEFLTN